MKRTRRVLIALLSLALVLGALFALSACKKKCKHEWQDATCTAPKTCALCSETEGEALGHTGGTATCAEQAKCSRCNTAYGEKSTTHDYAAATCVAPKTCKVCAVTEGEALGHLDANKDHTCDRCTAQNIGAHADADKDHDCDYCGAAGFGTHADVGPKDHKCDYCGAEGFGTHADADSNHICEYCGGGIGEHADANKDHVCDYGCNDVVGEHADANKDHVCDYGCTEAIGEHADADLDHACDYGCAVAIGAHADADKNHVCDYGCEVAIGAHADSETDNDHDCDYGCGEMLNGHEGGTATCSVQATCTVCGVKYGALAGHDFTKQVESLAYVMTRANCTESAIYYYCCSVCGASEANPNHTFAGKGSDGHKFGAYTVRLSNGVQQHVRTCTVCYFEDAEACAYDPNTVVPISELQLGAPATCLNPAKCSVCGTEYGSAAGHSWDNGEITTAATCTVAGVKTYTCACSATKTEAIDPLGHAWNEGDETTPATCTVAGVMTYTCQNENCPVGEKTEPIAATGHTPGEEATCTTAQICLACEAELVKKLGHEYDLTTQDATCTEARVDTYTCTRCPDSYTNTVGAPLGHSYNVDDSYEEREAGTCKYHTYTYCTGCEQYILTKTVIEHEGLTAVIDPAPTCIATGIKTVTCSGCELPPSEMYIEVAIDTVNGHAWEEGEAVDGKRTDRCTRCGAEKTVKTITADTALSKDDLKSELESDNGSKFQMDEGVQNLVGEGAKLSSGEVDKDALNLTEEQKEQIGDAPVYEFVIKDSNDETISDFEGNKIKVTLPYNEPVDDADSVAIWFIGEDGQLTSIMATYNNGFVTFETEHFSKYTVTRLKPAERCALYGHSATYKVEGGSCIEDLRVIVYCVRCGAKSEEVLWGAPLGHDFEESARTEATCETAGSVTYNCGCLETVISWTAKEDFKLAYDLSNVADKYELEFGKCDHSYTEILPALKHAWYESSREDASCTAAGSVTYVCENDENHTYTEALPQLPHDIVDETTDPTCSAGGYTTHYCVNCEYSYVDSYTAPLAHVYAFDEIDENNESDSVHWDGENLEFILFCENCGDEMTKTFALSELAKQEIKASCAVAGQEKYFVRMTVNGEAKDYLVKTVILAGVFEHEFSDVINGYDEETHWMGCKCGAKKNETAHEFGAPIVTKVATCKEEGQISYVCEDCGYVKTEKVEKLQHSFVMGTCSACGAKAGKGFYVTLVESYKGISGFALRIENLVIDIMERSELEGKITIELAELMLYVEDGKLMGAAKGEAVIFNGPIRYENATLALEAVIDGDYIYAIVSGDGMSGNEQIKLKYKTEQAIAAMINSIFMNGNMGGGDMGGGNMSDGSIKSAGTYESAAMPGMNEEMIGMMVGFMTETLIPVIDTLLVTHADSAEAILENLFAMIFTVEEVDGGYVFTLDFEKLYALNANLATLPAADLIDLYFGEGAYENLKTTVYELLAMKLSDVPEFVASQGLDYDALLLKINELCAMMGAPAGFDIGEMIADPDYGQLAVGVLLFNQENYTQMLDQIFGSMLPYAPVYAFVMPEGEAQLKQMVDMIISAFEGLGISFSTNAKGEFVGVDIVADELLIMGSEEMEVTASGSISFIANGEIDVTWGDIIADINASAVPPAEDMMESEPMVESGEDSGEMEYEGKSYHYFAQMLAIIKIDYQTPIGIMMQKDCGNWNAYQSFYNVTVASYGLYTLMDKDGGGAPRFLMKNEVTGEIAEVKQDGERWVAVLEDGTEIEIDPSLSESDPVAFFASVFGEAEFGSTKGATYPAYYYYNAATGEYADESQHDYSVVTEKLGKYCTDGIRYTYTCARCGDTYSYVEYECRDTEEAEIYFEDYGACGGYVFAYVCVECGRVIKVYSREMDGCTFGAPTESNLYAADGTTVIGKKLSATCTVCGLVYSQWETVENVGNCEYETIEGESVFVGTEEIFTYERSYYQTMHEYEYDYEFLDDENCESGVKIVTSCKNCTLYNERTSYDHSLMQKERIALTGSCNDNAYVAYMACPCGKSESVQVFNSCLNGGSGTSIEGDDGKIHEVMVWRCEECGLRRDTDKYTERDASTCTEVTYVRDSFKIGETLIEVFEYESRKESHNYTVVNAVLDGGIGSSCEDGATLYYECSDCHDEYDEFTTWHEQYEIARYDLTDPKYGGALHKGYLIVTSCACGKNQDVELETLCEINRDYDTEPFVPNALDYFWTFDTDGFYNGHSGDCYRQTCAVTNEECGFSIRRQTYWKQLPGQCVAARYETWQLGYDPMSGNFAHEITVATGETCQYHTYNRPGYETRNEIVEQYPNENPRIAIEHFECSACGSSAYDKKTYDIEQNIVARTYYAENKCGYGDYKVIEERYEYVKGHDFRMYEYREYKEGDWEKWEYDGYCECNEYYSSSYDKDDVRPTNRHAYNWGWQQRPTCSQDGVFGEWCPICNKMFNMSQKEDAYDHNWQQVEEKLWICVRCGMQNANGASGEVILEDMTGLYGNNEYYVAGYKSYNYVEYGWYVALYLLNGKTVEIDGEAVDIVELYEIEVTERDDVRAVMFSIAAVKEAAEALGLSPEDYEVRLSFVPYGADDADDYGITFDENYSDGSAAISEETTVRYFASGEAKRIAIRPETDGQWIIKVYTSTNGNLEVQNSQGYGLVNKYFNPGDGTQSVTLEAGETYFVNVMAHSKEGTTGVTVVLSPSAE